MKILLFCLFIGLTQCKLGRPNEKCWRECDWKGYVAKVTCKGEEDVCTCMQGPGGEAPGDSCDSNMSVEEKGKQNWTECHNLAAGNSLTGPIKNAWFRWEDKFDNTTDPVIDESYCYFLKNCDTETPSGCVPFPGAPCVAGPSTEECEETAALTCDPAEWDEDGLHWTCMSASGYETISIYTDGTTKLQNGTTCQTGTGKVDDACDTWEWVDDSTQDNQTKIAQVICGTDGWESTPGLSLKNTEDNGGAFILPNKDGVKNDGVCICAPLKISDESLEDPGFSLICETVFDPSLGEIQHGNGCALLCDGHFMMYIECYKGKWKNTAAYPFDDVATADVKC